VPIMLRRPSGADLDDLFMRMAGENLTYTGPGARAGDPGLPGYRYGEYVEQLGSADLVWERAKEALRRWEQHHHAGAAVAPVGAPLAVGTDVIVTIKLGPAFVLAPCRVVSVADEEDRFGFAYVTLPGHPEDGEEAFHLERADDGGVVFRVQVVSRPALPLLRLGGPVTALTQRVVAKRYLAGIRLAVAPVP